MMKLICSEDKTTDDLIAWSGDKALMLARFFFWAAGTEKQRSLEGLYRGILWETIGACPDIGKEIFPTYWGSHRSKECGRLDDDSFSIAELRVAFQRLVTSPEILQHHKLCIFIDGLDEYIGDTWDIAKGLVTWSTNPDIKIFVSFRPHNEFEHYFGQDPGRRLPLHELTMYDMICLVDDRLFSDERVDTLGNQEDYSTFERELVERAEGVFLWLMLAIRDLIDRLGSAYSPAQLRAKLATITDVIKNFYQRLLDSISPSDQILAFTTLLASSEINKNYWQRESRSDIIFSLLDDLAGKDLEHPDLYLGTLDPVLTDDEMTKRCEPIKMRIDKRCKGLLQTSAGGWSIRLGHLNQFIEHCWTS